MWVTGAASNGLAQMLGADDSCCGFSGEGGCGKCLLFGNDAAVNGGWTAVGMKKNLCGSCPDWPAHFDVAVPGYDNLQYSWANVCGEGSRGETYMTKDQSGACGDWYTRGGNTMEGCDCNRLSDGTVEQQALKAGCQLFTNWGWTTGDPQLKFQIVECPAEFVRIVGSAFNA